MRLIAIVLSWACLALGADQDSAVNGMWHAQMDWPSQVPGDNLSKRQRVMSFKPGLRQHLQELAHGAHVRRLRDQLPGAVVNEALGNPLDAKPFVDDPSRVQQDRVAVLSLRNVRFHFGGVFIRNCQDGKPVF